MGISIFVWVMMGIAFWHLAVLVPDRFWGGIIGAFLAAVAGALLSGLLLPQPGVPDDNPPGLAEAIRASPGALAALAASYLYGARRDRARGIIRDCAVPAPGSLASRLRTRWTAQCLAVRGGQHRSTALISPGAPSATISRGAPEPVGDPVASERQPVLVRVAHPERD